MTQLLVLEEAGAPLAGAPCGAGAPAGPGPKPLLVEVTLKLESSSTVTNVPSAFFMWAS